MRKLKKPMRLHEALERLSTDLLLEPLNSGEWKCTFEADVTEMRNGKPGVQTPYGNGRSVVAALKSFCERLRGKSFHRYSPIGDADLTVDVPEDLTV
jgi:hypothetical protein